MPLDLAQLEKVRHQGEKITAACPACRQAEADRSGNHLAYWPATGAFNCIAHPSDAEHNSHIFALAGVLDERSDRTAFRPRPKVTRKPPTPTPPKHPLPANYEELHRVFRNRIYDDPVIQQTLADEFNVSPETIKSLCFTTDTLGWSTKHQRPLYLYESGVKIRHHASAKIRFQWLMGRADKPWRAHYIQRPEVTRVYLTEGESDAIALLDAGLEVLFPKPGEIGSTIVASPGTSFLPAWAPLFTGKDLIICTDNDSAGDKAAERIAALCQSFTHSISRFNWSPIPAAQP